MRRKIWRCCRAMDKRHYLFFVQRMLANHEIASLWSAAGYLAGKQHFCKILSLLSCQKRRRKDFLINHRKILVYLAKLQLPECKFLDIFLIMRPDRFPLRLAIVYDPIWYRILEACYQAAPGKETLQAVCA